MKKLIALVTLLLTVQFIIAQRKTKLDDDWRFHYGTAEASARNYDDSQWRRLSLPHDWSVEAEAATAASGTVVGPFSTNSIGNYQTGFTVGGEGWYRKRIELGETDLEQRISLYFEGAYNHAKVWVNGNPVCENIYGYHSFRSDITPYCHAGSNTIAVRVTNTGNNTRWYAGSGIYRHVWLIRTPVVHLDEWDIFINANPKDKSVNVQLTAYNDTGVSKDCSISVDILDQQGRSVGQTTSKVNIGGHKSQPMSVSCQLSSVNTWSPKSPYRYTAVIRLTNDTDGHTDIIRKHFGIRSIHFSASQGFLLNGKPTLLRGGCLHHDNGLLGAAAFDQAEERKLKLLKDNGFNAVRCSHNIPSEHFLDVCDSLGLMVIDEAFDQWLRKKNPDDYHNHFAEHSISDIQTMVRRDRNHPSIIMWSIGNEIPGRIEPAGLKVAEDLRNAVRQLDTTRPVTAAICSWDEGDQWNARSQKWDIQDSLAFLSLDVGGYNYLYDKYEHDHATHPNRIMCGMESFPKQASENWNMVERHPYVIGDFVWTAMDYLGEAGIGSASIRSSGNQSMFQQWPWYNGWCGDIDLIGQKKPQSYYRDVVWRRSPVTMGVERPIPAGHHQSISLWGWQLEEQSWTFPDLDKGAVMTVNVYSRAPRVRLYLNGKSIGDKATSTTYWAGFSVAYESGQLRAVNLDKNGNEIEGEDFVLQTTGPVVGYRALYDKNTIAATTDDLAYVTIELVDAEGRVVTSDNTTRLHIKNAGCGQLIATGNASPNDMASFRSPTPAVFRGRALAIVRGNGNPGPVSLDIDMINEKP